MGDGVFGLGRMRRTISSASRNLKVAFCFCIGICAYKVKVILSLGQIYLHADTRKHKLRDVVDVGV